jgi:hypothetical protein
MHRITVKLLQFGFFIKHMLACNRIKFLDLDLLRGGALVLVSGVEMAGTGAGFQFDLFTHIQYPLDICAIRAHFEQYGINAIFIDGAQRGIGQAQRHPTILRLYPQAATLQIRQKTTLRFIVRVGNIVTHHRAFSRYLTDSCHDSTPTSFSKRRDSTLNRFSVQQFIASISFEQKWGLIGSP